VTSATAIINLDIEGPVISRHLYGHFAEHLGRCIYGGLWVGEDSPIPNIGGIREDVVEALRALRVPNLRWPGGCFADGYHWRDGIGPRDQRPLNVNRSWGNAPETNHFGTHEFMALCELLGAEPYIAGNVGSGTVQEMSDWVEYLTGDGDSPMTRLRAANGRREPWHVKFWGIGNETWGCGGNMRAEYFADLARQYSTFCRDYGSNQLYRVASGASDEDYAWTEALMRQVGKLGCSDCAKRGVFQAVSAHYYTFSGTWENKGDATSFDVDDYYRTMAAARRIDRILAGHSAVMDCYDPEAAIGLVLDEWGTWWDGDNGTLYQQNTLRDALAASVHLDIFHSHARRLVMANLAQTVNVLQSVLLTDGDTLILTPTYHVFAMNAGHQDATSLPVHLRGAGDALSASASVKDGAALISLTNTSADQPASVTLDLRGGSVGAVSAQVLTAEHLQDHNTATAPATVAPRALAIGPGPALTIPPHAFVTVQVPLR
jgi:alpha-L-arabinofuranosidase